jgi:hypothetical protein
MDVNICLFVFLFNQKKSVSPGTNHDCAFQYYEIYLVVCCIFLNISVDALNIQVYPTKTNK